MRSNLVIQLLVFVLVLVAINIIAALAGWEFRVSIIGSLVLTVIISLVLNVFRRRSR